MVTFFEEAGWDTRIQEFLYKLNTLLLDSDYDITFDGHKVVGIIAEEHRIQYYNKRWDSYEGASLSYSSKRAQQTDSYSRGNALHSIDLERETVDRVTIKKSLDVKELFPEFSRLDD